MSTFTVSDGEAQEYADKLGLVPGIATHVPRLIREIETIVSKLSEQSRQIWAVQQEMEMLTPGTVFYLSDAKRAHVSERLKLGALTEMGKRLADSPARFSAELHQLIATYSTLQPSRR